MIPKTIPITAIMLAIVQIKAAYLVGLGIIYLKFIYIIPHFLISFIYKTRIGIIKTMKALKKKRIYFVVGAILVASLLFSLIYSFYFDGRERFAEAALTSLDMSDLPSSVVKEAGNNFTVTAYDGGAVMEDYGGKIEFSSTDPSATLPSDYTFKNDTKEKAFTLNGWNDDLIAHNYATIASKLSTNNVDNVYIGVYETVATQTAYGNLYCENDFAFPGVTSSDNYDLSDLLQPRLLKELILMPGLRFLAQNKK